MGFKYLNSFLRDHCTTKSISKISLKSCSGKTIVIDTSIYLYKFKGENALLENMYLMISLFKKYNINPIFIFDGKPPIEKHNLILQRYQEKKEARETYWKMKTEFDINGSIMTNQEVQKMNDLKKQYLRIKSTDITSVKELMNAYGVTFYDAPNESDQLCAYLVNSGQAWACLSDDMDMFVYGCARIIRHISLLHETVVFHDMSGILTELKLSITEFRQIVILSGTDYCHSNPSGLDISENDIHIQHNKVVPLKKAVDLYREYKGSFVYNSFFEWLYHNKIITDINESNKICDMFDVSITYDMLGKEIESQTYHTNKRPNDWTKIRKIMEIEGFIFV